MKTLSKIFFSVFFLLALISLSLYIFRFANYAVSIALFFLVFIIVTSFKYIPFKTWKLYFLIIFHQCLLVILFIQDLNFTEFIKSFLLVNLSLLAFFSSKFHKPKFISKINFRLVFYWAVFIILFFELLQVFEYFIFGSSFSWFIFDEFSISSAVDVGRFQAVNLLSFMRPVSIFHEPSFLGLVLFSIYVWGDLVKIKVVAKLLIILGIILSFSTTIYIFFLLYFIPKVYKNKYFKFIFIIFSLIVVIKYNSELLGFFRIQEITEKGTSGYERIATPFFEVVQILFYNHNFLGIPYGQSPIQFNNSFFVVVSYYSILTPLLFYFMFGSLFKSIHSKLIMFNYFLIVGACLMVTGAFFTPEISFLLVISNYIFLSTQNKRDKLI